MGARGPKDREEMEVLEEVEEQLVPVIRAAEWAGRVLTASMASRVKMDLMDRPGQRVVWEERVRAARFTRRGRLLP